MLNFPAFLSYVLVSNISPGANAILSMSNASKYPLKKSLRFNLGISIGVFIVLMLCSALSLTLLNLFPAIRPYLTWFGAAYILWLAFGLVGNSPAKGEGEKKRKSGLFLSGLLLQFVNPNTIFYGITAFTNFIIPQYSAPVILVVFCALLSFIAFICTACWTFFGSIFSKIIAKHGRLINAILAALLVYCAVSLVLSQ